MIHHDRIQKLSPFEYKSGPVVYWMYREQRVRDNWALLYAQELAKEHGQDLHVVFCLRETFPYCTERLIDFMIGGLQLVEEKLHKQGISFHCILGDSGKEIPDFVTRHKAGALITDLSPLRHATNWRKKIAKTLQIPFYVVDAHNIVPVWKASDHQEFAARTIRNKIQRQLPVFLEEFPQLEKQTSLIVNTKKIDWQKIKSSIAFDKNVAAVRWLEPGEDAAHIALETFVQESLPSYSQGRNDPNQHALSNLSPYLHFGHIAAQRVALMINSLKTDANTDAFLEELIVRKELSDNYCYYNAHYDTPEGFPNWAKKTLTLHAHDKREFVYSLKELEHAQTHDDLWNAAQREMVETGKMHGYMRMYWAKKILEWSPSVRIAQEHAIYLNNTYFLDGRDPNGYVGIAWSMGGVHDRPWFEREIFGTIRYMSYNGAKSKFDIKRYIASHS